jgi:hypothetical protein
MTSNFSPLHFSPKGQIISKGLLVSSNSPKKRTNKFVFTTTMNSFVRFLGEFEDTKKFFRNYLTFSSLFHEGKRRSRITILNNSVTFSFTIFDLKLQKCKYLGSPWIWLVFFRIWFRKTRFKGPSLTSLWIRWIGKAIENNQWGFNRRVSLVNIFTRLICTLRIDLKGTL